MAFLRRNKTGGTTKDLEKALHAGLAQYRDRRKELVPWILTGSPTNPDLSQYDYASAPRVTEEQTNAMLAAVAEADPIVEWRLGTLMSVYVWNSAGPISPIYGLWHLRNCSWPADDRIQAMLAAAGVDPGDYLEDLLTIVRWSGDRQDVLRSRPWFDELVRTQPDTVRARLAGDANEIEMIADGLLPASSETLGLYAEPIAGLAADKSKKRRAAGGVLAARIGYDRMAPPLRILATTASPPVRAEAIRALGRLAGDDHRDEAIAFFRAECADDRSAAVHDAIAELTDAQSAPAIELDVTIPELDRSPPDAAALEAFNEMFATEYQTQVERIAQAKEWRKDNPQQARRFRLPAIERAEPTPPAVIEAAWRYVCEGGPVPEGLFGHARMQLFARPVVGRMRPLHAFRLLRVTGDGLRWGAPIPEMTATYRQTGHPTPLELQLAAEEAGYSRHGVMSVMPRRLPWSAEDTWPWVAALLPDFMAVIASGETDYWDSIDKYYDAIATLPVMPGELRLLLLTQAVSGRKAHRPLARQALGDDPDLVPSIVEYLGSRKNDERAEAALWLASLRADDATAALHKAAEKEKHDHAKGAILTALERLGEPIDPYLDPDQLLADAEKGLAKKLPAAAAWIPLDSLPPLTWRDGRAVDPKITRWLVVQAVRLKSPAPSPIVRRYFDLMDPDDVEAFAGTILSLWLAEDVRPISVEEATAMAQRHVGSIRRWPEHSPELAAMTDDQIVAHFLPRYLETPAGSATASKGMLSLTAAGGGLGTVAPVEAFLKKWYGHRSSQCKALVEMLAWIDDPTAIQLVLSVGSRFRTKGIQQEALRQAELLAERKGWTMEDLAYRTVPSGGFDAAGVLELDYGERRFTARLADDLSVVLLNPDGKQIKALPAARKTEDEDRVKLAKKELSGAKKQIKAAAKEQPFRLHEAMCVQRRFEVDDFRRYVLDHPVMSRLATRLVWAATHGDRRVLFRPLSDGTLVDAADDEISLDGVESVGLAHEVLDGAEAAETWAAHLRDYEITPLFPQFDRPARPQLADDQQQLTHCRGAIIDDRRIRSVLGRLGYELGPGEDGGSVSLVRRRFPSAGLEARVAVRGLFAMIMEETVGLEALEFGPLDEHETVPLRDVPEVLLVETIADVDRIIAAGEGIVEDWEKRVAW